VYSGSTSDYPTVTTICTIVCHGEYFRISNNRVDERVLIEHLNLLIHYVPLIMLLFNFWGGVC